MPSEDVKPVKKEEVEDEDDKKSLSSFVKNQKQRPINGSAEARPKTAKVKKEEPKEEDDDDDDDEPLVKRNLKKVDKDKKKKKKKRKEEEEEKKVAVTVRGEGGKKKEKKVFNLPGQKRDPPEERDPLRIFYETLYKQLPSSEMAAFWMMECGLLSVGEAKKVYEKKLKNQQQKLRSPIKAVTTIKRTTESVTVKRTLSSPASSAKKKIIETKTVSNQSKKRKKVDGDSENESDDDFIVARKKTKKQ